MSRGPLDVWLYGTHVASLSEDGDRMIMRWTPEAARRWSINSTVLSVLLPMTPSSAPHPARVHAFFAGLMPEGEARVQLAFEAGVEPGDVFGMMHAYGRDVAGALVLQPQGSGPPDDAGKLLPITDEAIAEKLARADSNAAPLGVSPGVTSISLAGMQPKIGLRRAADSRWFECLDGAASTHIIKPGRPRDSLIADLIWNEAMSMRVARRLGLTNVDVSIEQFAGLDALVVSRYDRHLEGDVVQRLHQEDCAQLLGLNTDDPARKFQYGGRLPSLRAIAEVLDREIAPTDALLALTTFNVAIGNTDAHAKNISVLHDEDGQTSLAPAYDVSPHRHYPNAGRRSAMDVNGKHDIDSISTADLISEAQGWGQGTDSATQTVITTLQRLQDELAEISDADRIGVPDNVLKLMRARVRGLIAG